MISTVGCGSSEQRLQDGAAGIVPDSGEADSADVGEADASDGPGCVATATDFLRINLDTRPPNATLLSEPYEGTLEVVTSTSFRLVLIANGAGLAFDSKGLLPQMLPGQTVWVQFRAQLTWTSQSWFIAVKESAEGPLLFAHHNRDLSLFDAGHFDDGHLLGKSVRLRDQCSAFNPSYACTSSGATYTLLDVAVGDGDEAALVSTGQEVALELDGHSYSFWLGSAARVSVEGHSTCADYMPHDFLEFTLVGK